MPARRGKRGASVLGRTDRHRHVGAEGAARLARHATHDLVRRVDLGQGPVDREESRGLPEPLLRLA